MLLLECLALENKESVHNIPNIIVDHWMELGSKQKKEELSFISYLRRGRLVNFSFNFVCIDSFS